jgi:outer membrane protein TolC
MAAAQQAQAQAQAQQQTTQIQQKRSSITSISGSSVPKASPLSQPSGSFPAVTGAGTPPRQ